MEKKRAFVEGCGFEQGSEFATIQLQGDNADKFVDMLLGLGSTAEASELILGKQRFGIKTDTKSL